MTPISFRSFLQKLESDGDLVRVKDPVDVAYGITREARKHDGREALLLENVTGHSLPVALGIFNRRASIAAAIDSTPETLVEDIITRSARPIEPVFAKGAPPCQEIVIENPDLLAELPFPKHYERDAGRYCSSGVIVARDPTTGAVNVSFARMEVLSDRIHVMINQWRHLLTMFHRAEDLGVDLPVAIVIGPDPVLWLEGAMPDGLAPLDCDEYAVAGGLAQSPLEVCTALTSDLPIPANAEIVIEGAMVHGRREVEGPFGDYPRIYDEPPRQNPVIVPSLITRRADAIYQDIVPALFEHFWLGGVPREADLLKNLRQRVHGVRQVHLTPGGVCRFHLVVQIEKHDDAHPRDVIMAALCPGETSRDIKFVAVVDTDIDPFDPFDVEWALATRVQWDTDLITVSRLPVALDPSAIGSTPREALEHGESVGCKAGVDATVPFSAGDLRCMFDKVDVPRD